MISRSIPFRIASHLVAVMTGTALWVCFQMPRQAEESTESIVVPDPALRNAAATAEIERRIERIITDAEDLEDRTGGITFREAAIKKIGEHHEARRKNIEKLALLRLMGYGYRSMGDLSEPLYRALAANDDDSSMAIFLEWHRRDPEEAFRQLSIRGAWLDRFIRVPAMLHAVTHEEVLQKRSRGGEGQRYEVLMIEFLARYLGEQGDLASLGQIYAGLEENVRPIFVSHFLEDWVPADGGAAARFVTDKMSPELRSDFLANLCGQKRAPLAWTDDFRSTLFAGDLKESEEMRSELEGQAARVDDEVPPQAEFLGDRILPPLHSAEKSPEEEIVGRPKGDPLPWREVSRLLRHDRDYPELLASGQLEPDAIREEMIRKVPELATHEEALDGFLFAQLFESSPSGCTKWAEERIPPDHAAKSLESILKHMEDPRAATSARLLESLPSGSGGFDGKLGPQISRLRIEVATWRKFAPEEAERSLTKEASK
jgi:hypothetical protein